MEHNLVAYVLTNYRQLLLYISYDKNNLYMFVTSKCFLVPITTAHIAVLDIFKSFDHHNNTIVLCNVYNEYLYNKSNFIHIIQPY